MTALKPAVSGDVGDTRVITLNGIDDLDEVTAIEAHVWRRGETPTTLTTTVTDSATAEVTVQLGAADGWLSDAEPGGYFFEIQATFGSSLVLTWPQGSPDTIRVRSEGDPT